MKLIRYIFLFISATVAAPLQLHGQQQFFVNTDTIDIGDVSIVSRSVNGAKGYRITSLTEAMLSDFKGSSLSELLEKSSTLLIKNYGSGGLATSSFRGMGASHTRVFWAGIPVNPPASGQVDFSLVPVTFSGTVEIYHGASPTGDGSGGPGGTISLNSVPDWNRGTSLFFRQGAGSFGYLSDDLSIITGSGLWQLFTNSYIRRADNDFTYTDDVSSSDNETKTRTNSSYIMKGISQELFLKKGNSIISGRYWLNFSDRELPGPVVSGENPGEKQKDKQLRVTASVRNYSTPVILDFRGAYMSDYLEYINPQAGIESNTRSSTLYFFGSGRFNVSSRSYLDISFSEKLSAVNSENHDGKNSSNLAVMRTEYSFTADHRFGVLVVAEINYSGSRLYAPLPSAGIDWRLSENGIIYLKGNVGASMTIPTLNDLYWNPGGNPDLQNETGFNSELSLEVKSRKKSVIRPSGELTFYNSRLWNMIKWMPGENGIWSPINLAEVNSSGAEADASLEIFLSHSQLSIGVKYSYNRVVNMEPVSENDATAGRQLPYVPFHKANTDLAYSYRDFTVNWFTGLTGLRYTTADNSLYLPGYIVNDLTIKYSCRLQKFRLGTSLAIYNIFDTRYEQIAYYPMPGRNWRLSVDINFGNRK